VITLHNTINNHLGMHEASRVTISSTDELKGVSPLSHDEGSLLWVRKCKTPSQDQGEIRKIGSCIRVPFQRCSELVLTLCSIFLTLMDFGDKRKGDGSSEPSWSALASSDGFAADADPFWFQVCQWGTLEMKDSLTISLLRRDRNSPFSERGMQVTIQGTQRSGDLLPGLGKPLRIIIISDDDVDSADDGVWVDCGNKSLPLPWGHENWVNVDAKRRRGTIRNLKTAL
jgi:hypothetical protein